MRDISLKCRMGGMMGERLSEPCPLLPAVSQLQYNCLFVHGQVWQDPKFKMQDFKIPKLNFKWYKSQNRNCLSLSHNYVFVFIFPGAKKTASQVSKIWNFAIEIPNLCQA